MISLRCSKGLNALYTDLPRIVVLGLICTLTWGFPGGSDGKVSACNVGDRVQSLGWEDPLEKEMATHSSVLAWRIPWTGSWQATIHGVAKSQTRLSN